MASSPSERSLARKRLAELRSAETVEVLLRPWFAHRAGRNSYRASPRDLDDLRADSDLLVSGVSHLDSGMASLGLVEGYVACDHLPVIVEGYLLVDATEDRANVVLHAAELLPTHVSPLLLAADLAEHHSPRESGRARDLVSNLSG